MPVKIPSYKHIVRFLERQRDEDEGFIVDIDYSHEEDNVTYEFLAVPQHGLIYDASSSGSNALIQGSTLAQDKSILKILYRSDPGWFSIPNSMANGTLLANHEHDRFQIRITQESSNNSRNGKIDVEYELEVMNRNNPPNLEIFTNEQVIVHVMSTVTDQCNGCWKEINDSADIQCECRTLLGNIKFSDIDKDVDRVRVDMSSLNGLISIDLSDYSKVDYNSCAMRNFAQWNCSGTGSNDQKTSFLAQPSDIGPILSKASYHSFKPGLDAIRINIYDGSGGECPIEADRRTKLDKRDNSMTSIHPSCYSLTGIIPVNVLPPQYNNQFFTIKMIPIEAWIGICGLLIYVSLGVLHLYRLRKKQNLQQSKISSRCVASVQGVLSRLRDNIKITNDGIRNKDKIERGDLSESVSSNSLGKQEPGCTLNSNALIRWLAFRDSDTNQTYYQDRLTRRVTWTRPKEEFELIDNNASEHKGNETSSDNENETGYHSETSTCEALTKGDNNNEINESMASVKEEYRWISFRDPGSKSSYYMDKFTRRVTWTKPNEECEVGD